MIRKNAVENILAERDILISVRNPFVVSMSHNVLTFQGCISCKYTLLMLFDLMMNRFDFSTPSHAGKIFIWSWST